jgi:TnpA family transposase
VRKNRINEKRHKAWGDGRTVAADGTQYDFYEENLLAGCHFRYQKMGTVAYRHVANNYVAVFCHFIPPGVWEAVYVIEGLMRSQLSVKADTVHSDTQGQSTTVFAFTHLLGINLMPRIRNWKDLHFFRPSKKTRYKNIDSLFTEAIDWDLIETHWKDLMQVALSIQEGKISSALLLRKLGNYSRQNRLFLAAQEVGRAVRNIFLLEWISSLPMRQQVTGTTNKIESYNGFAKWLSFGGDVIAENDPDEQQKHLRYNDLVATAVIRHGKDSDGSEARRVEDQCCGSLLAEPVPNQHREKVRRVCGEPEPAAGALDKRGGSAVQSRQFAAGDVTVG